MPAAPGHDHDPDPEEDSGPLAGHPAPCVPGTGPGPGPGGACPPGGRRQPGPGLSGGPAPGLSGGPAAGLPRCLDWQAMLEALAAAGIGAGEAEDQDAVQAEFLEAEAGGRAGELLPPGQLAGMTAEYMEPGPALAGWLAVADPAGLDEYALAGLAASARRLASWAQSRELAAVAQIVSRAAAADRKIGLREQGRPARLCQDAVSQVAMALRLSDYAAGREAQLALTLGWRLPATGQALTAGWIDDERAKLIADATDVLSEDAARAVEAKVLPRAGKLVRGDLQQRLRTAVIAADPEGAERRRAEAERRARVGLYPDEEQTATLAGHNLPALQAAAAMARITALASAKKAAGERGGINLLRAQVMVGLLLGTLPWIPPAEGAPPDQPPDAPPGQPPADSGPDGARPGGPGPGSNGLPNDGSGPEDDCPDDECPGNGRPDGPVPADGPVPPGEDVPWPGDEDAPTEDDDPQAGQAALPPTGDEDEEDRQAPAWPVLPGVIPPGLVRRPAARRGAGAGTGADRVRPRPGLLDMTLPWRALAHLAEVPGRVGRIGPVTAPLARALAAAAEHDPAAQWRIIVTNARGEAIAVARIHRRLSRARPGGTGDGDRRPRGGPPGRPRDGPGSRSPGTGPLRAGPPGAGLVGRVTLVIRQDQLTAQAGPGSPGITGAALRAAERAARRAAMIAEADAAAGGCAHRDQAPGYRPPPRLREFITARDVTCRNPVCRQPAWQSDLDHTLPYDQGGRTCPCDLGGACRRDHQLKQHPRWKLEQVRPGHFTWTTPAGRTYASTPYIYDT